MLKKDKKEIFENLTMAPIDKELINKKLLNIKEKEWINNYHKKGMTILRNLCLK